MARGRVRLEAPGLAHEDAFVAAVRRSRRLHRPWVYAPSTTGAYRAWVQRLGGPTHVGWLIVERESNALAGVVNVSEIVRGGFGSGYLGYYGFVPYAGRGYMHEGVRLAMRVAFREMGLHRLEANIQPGNTASKRLARGLGFRREGYSPRYLRIGGRWRDHERWAILREMMAK